MSDLEQKPSRTLWVSAAVIALVLHVGGAALALTNLHGEEPEDVSGVSAIEVGVELAAPNREVTDLPAGPDADASVASPQVNEQKAEVKETDLPKDTPNEIEDADRVVTENDNKKPTEEEQKVAAVQTAASQVGRCRGHRDADRGSRARSAALGGAGHRQWQRPAARA